MNSLLSGIYRSVVMGASDILFDQRALARLKLYNRAQWWDRQRIEAYQNERLKELVRIASAESPFYNQMYQGVDLERFRGLADLQKLPIVTKSDIRPYYPSRMVRPTPHRQFEESSSGSTGENFFVTTDTRTSGLSKAALLFMLDWAGWRFGEPHIQTGMARKRGLQKRIKDRVIGCHYFIAYDLTEENVRRCLDLLDGKNIKHLWGYAGALFVIAQQALKMGWNKPLKTVVSWGDNLYQHYREAMEGAFGTRVIDTYGCAEGIQMACQCREEGNYHLFEMDTIVEFLDDEGLPAANDTPAHLILTRLHPGPTPLIRYRVGDMGVRGDSSPCACGRGWARMERVLGRDTDIVLTPDGNKLIVHFFTGRLEHYKQIKLFQVVQERAGEMDIAIVPNGEFPPELFDRIRRDLIENGARGMDIKIRLVNDIAPSKSSKRRFVINRMQSMPGINRSGRQ